MPDDANETTPAAAPCGRIAWHDLTVPDAESVRDFYAAVVGWKFGMVSMGDYNDFTMIAPSSGAISDFSHVGDAGDGEGNVVAGICWARGANASLPAQWLMHVTVADIDKSAKACVALGGALLTPIKSIGGARFCVIRDPAGAVCGLYSS